MTDLDSKHFSYSIRQVGWGESPFEIHIDVTSGGLDLLQDYRRYHQKNLWELVKDYLQSSRIFGDEKLHFERGDGGYEDWYIWVHVELTRPECEAAAAKAVLALEDEALRSWTTKTALSLTRILRERLQNQTFLIDSILAYVNFHGTKATRDTLLHLGLVSTQCM
jgi:hypothetical protein